MFHATKLILRTFPDALDRQSITDLRTLARALNRAILAESRDDDGAHNFINELARAHMRVCEQIAKRRSNNEA